MRGGCLRDQLPQATKADVGHHFGELSAPCEKGSRVRGGKRKVESPVGDQPSKRSQRESLESAWDDASVLERVSHVIENVDITKLAGMEWGEPIPDPETFVHGEYIRGDDFGCVEIVIGLHNHVKPATHVLLVERKGEAHVSALAELRNKPWGIYELGGNQSTSLSNIECLYPWMVGSSKPGVVDAWRCVAEGYDTFQVAQAPEVLVNAWNKLKEIVSKFAFRTAKEAVVDTVTTTVQARLEESFGEHVPVALVAELAAALVAVAAVLKVAYAIPHGERTACIALVSLFASSRAFSGKYCNAWVGVVCGGIVFGLWCAREVWTAQAGDDTQVESRSPIDVVARSAGSLMKKEVQIATDLLSTVSRSSPRVRSAVESFNTSLVSAGKTAGALLALHKLIDLLITVVGEYRSSDVRTEMSRSVIAVRERLEKRDEVMLSEHLATLAVEVPRVRALAAMSPRGSVEAREYTRLAESAEARMTVIRNSLLASSPGDVPFIVQIFGPAGIGKSTVSSAVKALFAHVLADRPLENGLFYRFKFMVKHYDDWNGAPFLDIDDASVDFKADPGVMEFMKNVLSQNPVVLPSAELSTKQNLITRIKGALILSNNKEFVPLGNQHQVDKEAIERRVTWNFQMKWKDDASKVRSPDFSHAVFEVVSHNGTPVQQMKGLDFGAFLHFLQDKMTEHREDFSTALPKELYTRLSNVRKVGDVPIHQAIHAAVVGNAQVAQMFSKRWRLLRREKDGDDDDRHTDEEEPHSSAPIKLNPLFTDEMLTDGSAQSVKSVPVTAAVTGWVLKRWYGVRDALVSLTPLAKFRRALRDLDVDTYVHLSYVIVTVFSTLSEEGKRSWMALDEALGKPDPATARAARLALDQIVQSSDDVVLGLAEWLRLASDTGETYPLNDLPLAEWRFAIKPVGLYMDDGTRKWKVLAGTAFVVLVGVSGVLAWMREQPDESESGDAQSKVTRGANARVYASRVEASRKVTRVAPDGIANAAVFVHHPIASKVSKKMITLQLFVGNEEHKVAGIPVGPHHVLTVAHFVRRVARTTSGKLGVTYETNTVEHDVSQKHRMAAAYLDTHDLALLVLPSNGSLSFVSMLDKFGSDYTSAVECTTLSFVRPGRLATCDLHGNAWVVRPACYRDGNTQLMVKHTIRYLSDQCQLGACGAAVIDSKGWIRAIHVAGINGASTGSGSLVCRELVEQLLAQHVEAPDASSDNYSIDELLDKDFVVGQVDNYFPFFKTSLIRNKEIGKIMESERYPRPVKKPAVLGWDQYEIDGAKFIAHPIVDGLNDISALCKPELRGVVVDDPYAMKVACELGRSLAAQARKVDGVKTDVFSMVEILNGYNGCSPLNMASSTGSNRFGTPMQKKKLFCYNHLQGVWSAPDNVRIAFDDACARLESGEAFESVLPVLDRVFRVAPKDELRKPGKSARLFFPSPLMVQLLLKRYLGELVSVVKADPLQSMLGVGLRPVVHWDSIATALGGSENSLVACDDLSGFDKSVTRYHKQMVNACYLEYKRACGWKEEEGRYVALKALLEHLVDLTVVYGPHVFKFRGVQGSGADLTSITDGVINVSCWLAACRVARKQSGEEDLTPFAMLAWARRMGLLTYGDDKIMSMPNAEFYSVCVQHMTDQGFTVTSATNKLELPVPVHLRDSEFMGRGFRFVEKHGWLCPLRRASIQHTWSYRNDGTTERELFDQTHGPLLLEASFHGPEYFSQMKEWVESGAIALGATMLSDLITASWDNAVGSRTDEGMMLLEQVDESLHKPVKVVSDEVWTAQMMSAIVPLLQQAMVQGSMVPPESITGPDRVVHKPRGMVSQLASHLPGPLGTVASGISSMFGLSKPPVRPAVVDYANRELSCDTPSDAMSLAVRGVGITEYAPVEDITFASLADKMFPVGVFILEFNASVKHFVFGRLPLHPFLMWTEVGDPITTYALTPSPMAATGVLASTWNADAARIRVTCISPSMITGKLQMTFTPGTSADGADFMTVSGSGLAPASFVFDLATANQWEVEIPRPVVDYDFTVCPTGVTPSTVLHFYSSQMSRIAWGALHMQLFSPLRTISGDGCPVRIIVETSWKGLRLFGLGDFARDSLTYTSPVELVAQMETTVHTESARVELPHVDAPASHVIPNHPTFVSSFPEGPQLATDADFGPVLVGIYTLEDTSGVFGSFDLPDVLLTAPAVIAKLGYATYLRCGFEIDVHVASAPSTAAQISVACLPMPKMYDFPADRVSNLAKVAHLPNLNIVVGSAPVYKMKLPYVGLVDGFLLTGGTTAELAERRRSVGYRVFLTSATGASNCTGAVPKVDVTVYVRMVDVMVRVPAVQAFVAQSEVTEKEAVGKTTQEAVGSEDKSDKVIGSGVLAKTVSCPYWQTSADGEVFSAIDFLHLGCAVNVPINDGGIVTVATLADRYFCTTAYTLPMYPQESPSSWQFGPWTLVRDAFETCRGGTEYIVPFAPPELFQLAASPFTNVGGTRTGWISEYLEHRVVTPGGWIPTAQAALVNSSTVFTPRTGETYTYGSAPYAYSRVRVPFSHPRHAVFNVPHVDSGDGVSLNVQNVAHLDTFSPVVFTAAGNVRVLSFARRCLFRVADDFRLYGPRAPTGWTVTEARWNAFIAKSTAPYYA